MAEQTTTAPSCEEDEIARELAMLGEAPMDASEYLSIAVARQREELDRNEGDDRLQLPASTKDRVWRKIARKRLWRDGLQACRRWMEQLLTQPMRLGALGVAAVVLVLVVGVVENESGSRDDHRQAAVQANGELQTLGAIARAQLAANDGPADMWTSRLAQANAASDRAVQ